jgi:hypothetical protein
MKPDAEILYFGCLNRIGHDLHSKRGTRTYPLDEVLPWGDHIDAGFLPQRGIQQQGQACSAHKSGWTAVAFWDRSVDRRHGSHSTFIVHDDVTAEELITEARRQWPEVFARFNFPVVVDAPAGSSPAVR